LIYGISMRAFSILFILISFSVQPLGAEENRECPSHHEGPIAIFIDPTDEEIELMKRENGEDDFYTIADDSLYYKWEAVEFLKKRNVPYCFTRNEGHEFTGKGNIRKYSIKRKCADWCLILWNGRNEPVWVSAVDIIIYDNYLKGID